MTSVNNIKLCDLLKYCDKDGIDWHERGKTIKIIRMPNNTFDCLYRGKLVGSFRKNKETWTTKVNCEMYYFQLVENTLKVISENCK